jgi:uncharacterized protein (DUF2062 family)
MVFKRRDKPSIWASLREWVYPRSGWRRAAEYIGHRLKRLPDTPHRIALGFACGVGVSFTPLFGAHFLAAAFFAWILRGNILAALTGTFVGNPLTTPFMAAASLETGRMLAGKSDGFGDIDSLLHSAGEAINGLWEAAQAIFGFGHGGWHKASIFFSDIFLPYLAGSVITGPLGGLVFYVACKPLIIAYQARRRVRLLERARRRAQASATGATMAEGRG